jgi:outer membrane murein-binding lipoprotein Lpp
VDIDSDRSRAEAAATVQSHMKAEVEELRAKISEMASDMHSLTEDNKAMGQRCLRLC